jgi:hypothetical protein
MMNKVTPNIDGVVDLQNCMDILKSEPGPGTDTYQISSDNGNQVDGKRGEEVTYIKEEEDPWPATSTGIETEPAVSCLCVCPLLFTLHRYPEFPFHRCVSVCIKLCNVD